MNSAIRYFNRWFKDSICAGEHDSVKAVLDALNRHALARDETAQDYVMPPKRYYEKGGRFRILGENQDVWHCFVYEGDEVLPNPPVYFETCLDLKRDHGFSDDQIIGGDHVLVCSEFQSFLWQLLGSHICLRLRDNQLFAAEVSGVQFDEVIVLDSSFFNPLGNEFPAGFTCWFNSGVICIPDWGAAFLDSESRDRFLDSHDVLMWQRWP